MKGDFSRISFDPAKQYRRVLQQQGRVALDADLNEQADIDAYLDEISLYDVIGDSGAPYHWAGPDHGDGFKVFAKPPNAETDPVTAANMLIKKGRYYLRGKLADNPADVTLESQIGQGAFANGRYIAYLDLWDRLLTAVEDPELREIALGGPDTATRIKGQWRVRVLGCAPNAQCSDFPSAWTPDPRILPTMSVVTVPVDPGSDPCLLPVTGGYQGLENQLYRIEIHSVGPGVLKWSRDNASLCARIDQVDAVSKVLTVSSLGRDPARTLDSSPFLEIVTEDDVANRRSGLILSNFKRVAEDRIEIMDAAVTGNDLLARNGAIIRAWDGMANAVGGAVEIAIENGISVKFQKIDYRVGDYWLFAARALTNVVQWPSGAFLEPRGELHAYAILGLLDKNATKWQVVSDCRHLFSPLTESIRLAYVSGDGQEAMPNMPILQPLTVVVYNGLWPVKNAKVRFSVKSGDIQISGNDVMTDANGIAFVTSAMKLANSTVQARLIDDANQPISSPVQFNLNLSIASNVYYEPGAGCVSLNGITTVQGAVDRLRAIRRLSYEGGDGQIVPFNGVNPSQLPKSLSVRVTSLCGAVSGVPVLFTASNGSLSAGQPVMTNADGLAECFWTPAATPVAQTVTAVLANADAAEKQFRVVFNTQVVQASDVKFTSTCQFVKATNVNDAINALCPASHLYLSSGAGQVADNAGKLAKPIVVRVLAGGNFPIKGSKVTFVLESAEGQVTPVNATTDDQGFASADWVLGAAAPQQVLRVDATDVGESVFVTAARVAAGKQGFHVSGVSTSASRKLQNDEFLTVAELQKGILIEFDAPYDPSCFDDKPVGELTLEVPASSDGVPVFPIASTPEQTSVYLPWIVAGKWSATGPKTATWIPGPNAVKWLEQLDTFLKGKWLSGVTLRLALRGHAIWSQASGDNLIYLDGLSLGRDQNGKTYLNLGDGAGLPGSRFEMWLRLVNILPRQFVRLGNLVWLDANGVTLAKAKIGAATPPKIPVGPVVIRMAFSDAIDPATLKIDATGSKVMSVVRSSGLTSGPPLVNVPIKARAEGKNVFLESTTALTAGNYSIVIVDGVKSATGADMDGIDPTTKRLVVPFEVGT